MAKQESLIKLWEQEILPLTLAPGMWHFILYQFILEFPKYSSYWLFNK